MSVFCRRLISFFTKVSKTESFPHVDTARNPSGFNTLLNSDNAFEIEGKKKSANPQKATSKLLSEKFFALHPFTKD